MTILEQRTMHAICDIARSLRTIAECMEKASKEAEAEQNETNRKNETRDEEK